MESHTSSEVKDCSYSVQNNGVGWSAISGRINAASISNWNTASCNLSGRSKFLDNVGGHASGNKESGDQIFRNKQSEENLSYEGLVGATGGSDSLPDARRSESRGRALCSAVSGWGNLPPPRIGLLGGSETALNSGTSNWGAPQPPSSVSGGWNDHSNNNVPWDGSARKNENNDSQNISTQELSSAKANTWAQAAGKGLKSSVSNNNLTVNTNTSGPQVNAAVSGNSKSSSKIKAEEQLKELKMAAAFSDGWGQLNVNQNSNWDCPPSPDASPKEENSLMWSSPANTGTEIWENNVRHQVKANNNSSSSGPQWGHTPTTHIGGTWGEEEDTSNMWTGVPPPPQQQQHQPRVHHPQHHQPQHQQPQHQQPQHQQPQHHQHPQHQQPQHQQPQHQQPQHQQQHHQSQQHIHHNNNQQGPQNHGSIGNGGGGGGSHWGGESASAWDGTPSSEQKHWGNSRGGEQSRSGWEDLPPQPPQDRHQQSNLDDGTSVWGNPRSQSKVSFWKEMPAAKPATNLPPPSLGGQGMPPAGPGMIRLPPNPGGPNKGDLSAWGKPQQHKVGSLNWTDLSPHCNSPGPGSWDESRMKGSQPGTPSTPNSGSWGDPSSPMSPYWGAKPKNPSTNWSDDQIDTSNWSGPSKQGGKPLSKELIWASKQFRILTEMGFKKEEVENVLRMKNMNLEESLSELHAASVRESQVPDVDCFQGRPQGRPVSVSDDLGLSERSLEQFVPSFHGGSSNFQSPQVMATGFGGIQGFKQPMKNPNMNPNHVGNQPSRINQGNFPNTSQLHHLVQQIQMAVQAGHLNPQILNQPLAPQTLLLLYNLLQEIKTLQQFQQRQLIMAARPGFSDPDGLQINVQITQTKQRLVNLQNQISAQQALFLKQQHIQPQNVRMVPFKSLEPMPGYHNETQDLSFKEPVSVSRLNTWNQFPAVAKEDSSGNLQNHTNPGTTSAALPGNMPASNISNNSKTISCSDPSETSNSTNERSCVNSNSSAGGNDSSGDFSRAPGSIAKLPSGGRSPGVHSHPNPSGLHSLLTQGEGAWSSLPHNHGESGGWPEANTNSSSVSGNDTATSSVTTAPSPSTNSSPPVKVGKDGSAPCTPNSSGAPGGQAPNFNISDLVPEFEPGKPWKGNSQMKNAEDDPHMTPGSVAQSPFSLNTIKEAELFNWNSKNSPVAGNTSADSLVASLTSLTCSTWAFTPQSTSKQSSNPNPGGGRKSDGPKGSWRSLSGSNVISECSSASSHPNDPWSATNMCKAVRGPPPGISGQSKSIGGGQWANNQRISGTDNRGSSRQSWGAPPDLRSGLSPSWDRQNLSNYLVLRNLTPQIDGSTLKTLCIQHGPLQLFHLYLNHGIALARYATREEAFKAQSALNNCVLGNTTILADVPTETEISQYNQVAGTLHSATGSIGSWSSSQSTGQSSAFRSTSFPFNNSSNSASGNGGGNTGSSLDNTPTTGAKVESSAWNSSSLNLPASHLWSFPGTTTASNIWVNRNSLSDRDHGSQASLNSFLPEDLLNGESI